MSLKTSFSKDALTKAVCILGAECFGALSMANAMGGMQTEEWQILHNNTWFDIVSEAKASGIDFSKLECAVTKTPLLWSATIRYALGEITNPKRQRIFWRDVKTVGQWQDPSVVADP